MPATEQRGISGPCCMLVPSEMSAEGSDKKMSGLPGMEGEEMWKV